MAPRTLPSAPLEYRAAAAGRLVQFGERDGDVVDGGYNQPLGATFAIDRVVSPLTCSTPPKEKQPVAALADW